MDTYVERDIACDDSQLAHARARGGNSLQAERVRETGVGEREVDININNFFFNTSAFDMFWQYVVRT